MGSGFAQGVEPLPCSFLPLFHGPGPIDRGAWLFRCLFGVGGKPSGGGRRRVGYAHPPAAGQARQRACSGAGAFGPGPRTPPPPRMAAPILPAPPGNRSSAGGEALAKGRVGTLGCAGGRRRFAAWAAKRKKGEPEAKPPAPPFWGAARPRRPPRTLEVSPSFQMERLFLRPKTYAQN